MFDEPRYRRTSSSRVILGFAVLSACGAKPRASAPAKHERAEALQPQAPVKNWEQEYRSIKSVLGEGLPPDPASERGLVARLREIVEKAQDPHLRANACILAASVYDQKKDYVSALSFYRQAIALVPQEPSGYALSALTLAKLKRFADAIKMQQELVRRDPDDLQGWLLLGELNMRAKRPERAAKAYAAYETRRSGLLEGLTRKNKAGAYVLGPAERAGCVQALAAAPDAGTSLALVYALKSDPNASVRAAIVEVMHEQRFIGYLRPLQEWKGQEPDSEIVLQIDATLKAIKADPVKTRPEVGDIAKPSASGPMVHPQGKDE